MLRIRLAGMLKWERPEGDVRLIDGGTTVWNEETWRSHDPLVGSLTGFEALTEGVGDEAPAGTFVFAPPGDVVASDLSYAALQGTRLQCWTAEIDDDTGLPVGSPKLELDAIVDVTKIVRGKGVYRLKVDFVSRAQRLMMVDTNNVLSPGAHKRVWPDEDGLNNATGVPTVVAWGVAGPARGTTVAGGNYSGGGGDFGGAALV